MSHQRNGQHVRLVPSSSGRWLQPLVLYASIVGFPALFVALLATRPASRVAAAGVLVAAGPVAYRAVCRTGLELLPDELVVRRAFSTRTYTWSDVAAVDLRWHSLRDGTGYSVALIERGRGRVGLSLPPLASDAVPAMTRFFADNGIPVALNPSEPWCDRFGTWHGEGLELDPYESIRSIRRASVGPWRVSITVSGDGFRAVTETAASGDVIEQSPLRPTLPVATDDAIRHVTAAVERWGRSEV